MMILFLSLGLLIIIRPDLYLRFAQWQTRIIWKAEFKFTKSTEKRMRIIGIIFLLMGLFVGYVHLISGKT